MFRFAKERSDKKEDGAGWIILRAKVLKASTRFELGFSNGFHVTLDWAVELFMIACGLKEDSPYEVWNCASGNLQFLVPVSSRQLEVGVTLAQFRQTDIDHVVPDFVGV